MTYLCSLEERVGITAQQQQQAISDVNDDGNHVDTIIDKFRAIAKLIAPSWVSTMTQGNHINKNNNTNTDSSSNTAAQYQQDAPIQKFKSLNKAMTDIMIHCVVLFKRSPIPGNLYNVDFYQTVAHTDDSTLFLSGNRPITLFAFLLFVCRCLVQ